MSNKVLGVRNVGFKGNDGSFVEGYSIFYTYKGKDMLCGDCADKVFISMACFERSGGLIPDVGDEIDFSYNKFGKIQAYSIY